MHRIAAIASVACLLNVGVLCNPYRPTWVADPEAEIDCSLDEYECAPDKQENSCKDYPNRICVQTCAHKKAQGETVRGCYSGCQVDPKTGKKPEAACMHKNLYPMLPQDTLAFVVLLMVAVAAGASGIGGGGLNVPILMILANFNIKEAVPLSHAAVLGNAIGQLIVNSPQKHPTCDVRPLIHYEIAYLLLPAMLGGNSLGVVLGRVLPASLLVVLSMGVILLAATKSLMKGVHLRKECLANLRKPKDARTSMLLSEPSPLSLQIENPAAQVHAHPVQQLRDLFSRQISGGGGGGAADAFVEQALSAPQPRATPLVQEPMRIPWKVVAMMVVFNVFVLFDVMLQSQDVWPYTVRCSGLYWGALVGLYPFIVGALWLGLRSLKHLAKFHQQRGELVVEGEPNVTTAMAVGYASATSLVGLLAGILGLGGGEFLVPLLLEFGLQPRVASATSGFLMVFSTSNDILHYMIAGTLQPVEGYAAMLMVIAFIGAVVGLKLRDSEYVKVRSYLIVFTVASLLYASMALLIYRGLIIDNINWAMGSFC